MIQKDKQLASVISVPTLDRKDKIAYVSAALEKKNVSSLTINLFGALAENNRLTSVEKVIESYGLLMSAKRNEVRIALFISFSQQPGVVHSHHSHTHFPQGLQGRARRPGKVCGQGQSLKS